MEFKKLQQQGALQNLMCKQGIQGRLKERFLFQKCVLGHYWY